MHWLSFAKGALAAFWLLALVNLLYPLGDGWFWPVTLLAAAMVCAHLAEVLVLRKRLAASSKPVLDRLSVLAFGVLHLPMLPR